MTLFEKIEKQIAAKHNVEMSNIGDRIIIFNKDAKLYALVVDMKKKVIFVSIDTDNNIPIHYYNSEEELFTYLEQDVLRVEMVFFVEENGLPEIIRHTSSLNVYDEDCANIRKMYEQQGINVIAVEFYSLFNLLPKLVADKITHGYVMRLMERKFKELKKLFPQGVEEKIYPDSGESINREDAITEDNPFESSDLTMFIYKPNKNPERLSIDSYNCVLGCLYCSIYVFPYDQFFIFFCDKDTFSTLAERLQAIHKELFKD